MGGQCDVTGLGRNSEQGGGSDSKKWEGLGPELLGDSD